MAMKLMCPNHNLTLVPCETRWGIRYQCPASGCDVVCWSGSTATPADSETRTLRKKTHDLFDPLWLHLPSPFHKPGEKAKHRRQRRVRAYRWLAESLGLSKDETHIGYFDADQCRKAIAAIEGIAVSVEGDA